MEQVLQKLDEASLIRQCQSELPYVVVAFGELVRRHERYVFNVCQRYLESKEDAEDATQEVFLRVFHVLPGFEGRSQFRTWLFRIAMNHCHSSAKKRQHHEADSNEAILNMLAGEGFPEQVVSDEEERDCVQRSLKQMRTQDMEILNLRFTGELSLDEIASTLSSNLSATKMRLYRAMENFKKIY